MGQTTKLRVTITKEERRVLMEISTKTAADEILREKLSRDEKTAKLKALRLAAQTQG